MPVPAPVVIDGQGVVGKETWSSPEGAVRSTPSPGVRSIRAGPAVRRRRATRCGRRASSPGSSCRSSSCSCPSRSCRRPAAGGCAAGRATTPRCPVAAERPPRVTRRPGLPSLAPARHRDPLARRRSSRRIRAPLLTGDRSTRSLDAAPRIARRRTAGACGCAASCVAPGSPSPPSSIAEAVLWTVARFMPLEAAPVIGAGDPGRRRARPCSSPSSARDRPSARPPWRSTPRAAWATACRAPWSWPSGSRPPRRRSTTPRRSTCRATLLDEAARPTGSSGASGAMRWPPCAWSRPCSGRASRARPRSRRSRPRRSSCPVLLLPNPQDAVIAQQRDVREAADRQAERLDDLAEDLESKGGEAEDPRTELAEELRELARQLRDEARRARREPAPARRGRERRPRPHRSLDGAARLGDDVTRPAPCRAPPPATRRRTATATPRRPRRTSTSSARSSTR